MSSSSNFHKNVMEVQGAFLTVQVSMNFRGLLILFFQDTFGDFRNIVAFGLKMEKRSSCRGMVDKKNAFITSLQNLWLFWEQMFECVSTYKKIIVINRYIVNLSWTSTAKSVNWLNPVYNYIFPFEKNRVRMNCCVDVGIVEWHDLWSCHGIPASPKWEKNKSFGNFFSEPTTTTEC